MKKDRKMSEAFNALLDGFVGLLVQTTVETVLKAKKPATPPKRNGLDRRCRAQPCPNQGLGPRNLWLCAHHLKALPPKEQRKALEKFREKKRLRSANA